ncbi:hypothetical protein P775_16920 [Puniceibacterium antarcticum]|uniref:Uncharacterized protein n=1 Tax=Puniceibacterium antarcticum TaxID=1206336 RepID=A0A2G8RCX0_9RHOB|nr:hypothetical protein [Puniceibacterium antarcticum]PIL18948.1 hypothetical protein P775_16920 [Puniceibacterium antarcticum]
MTGDAGKSHPRIGPILPRRSRGLVFTRTSHGVDLMRRICTMRRFRAVTFLHDDVRPLPLEIAQARLRLI